LAAEKAVAEAIKMATFLDVTSLSHFTNIFVFLLVLVLSYATFTMFHAFGDNKIIYAIVALLIGIFVLMSDLAVMVVAGVSPFLGVVLLFVVFTSVAMKMMGSEMEAFNSMKWIFLIVMIMGMLIYGGIKAKESITEKEKAGALSSSMKLVFSPKFIGLILLFAIAVFTIGLMAGGGHGHGH
jgi:hypothetical protein